MTPGQLSGDGKWQWDGTQWVPAPPAAIVPAAAAYPPAVLVRTPPTNSLAVVSLVSAILSWILCPFVGAVVAVITGHIARNQIRRTGEAGDGVALAGLIIGYLHLAAWVIIGLIWLVLLGGMLAFLAALGVASPTPSP